MEREESYLEEKEKFYKEIRDNWNVEDMMECGTIIRALRGEDPEDVFCGTVQFNQASKNIDKLLESGMSKMEIIRKLPKKIQELMEYFEKYD